jgi:glycosyltransferase involved in cell wall biosynthesis
MKTPILKISHILYSGLGGVNDVCNVLGKIDKRIFTKTSFIQVGSKRFIKRVSNKKQKTDFVKTYRFLSFYFFISVLKKIINQKPNLIFVHNFQILPTILYKMIFNHKLKLVYVDHTPYTLKTYKDFFLNKIFNIFFDLYIVLNKENYKYFLKKIKINSKKIKIIPNSVSKNFIKNTNKTKLKQKTFFFGMASRINFQKRHDLIIDAIEHNLLKEKNIKVYFAGSGENVQYLKQKIQCKKKFKFFNNLDSKNLKKWYSKLDCYIQATNGEGHSTSILQAMGMNLPVIASNVSGIKNFLYPAKNIGIIFKNDPFSLAKAIKYFISLSKSEKNRIIFSQKKYILSKYSEDIFLEKYEKIINESIFLKNSTRTIDLKHKR